MARLFYGIKWDRMKSLNLFRDEIFLTIKSCHLVARTSADLDQWRNPDKMGYPVFCLPPNLNANFKKVC